MGTEIKPGTADLARRWYDIAEEVFAQRTDGYVKKPWVNLLLSSREAFTEITQVALDRGVFADGAELKRVRERPADVVEHPEVAEGECDKPCQKTNSRTRQSPSAGKR